MNLNITEEEAKIIFGCLLDVYSVNDELGEKKEFKNLIKKLNDKGAKLPYGYKKIYAEDIKYILTPKRKKK